MTKRTHRITVRFKAHELDQLKARASAAGLDASTYLRMVALLIDDHPTPAAIAAVRSDLPVLDRTHSLVQWALSQNTRPLPKPNK